MIPKLFGLCASFGLLIIVVHGGIWKELREMAQKRYWIHGIFQPVELIAYDAGYLVYSGISKIDNRPVAIKFKQDKDKARNEYAMYTYLNAIETDVEKYGIPNIYYFNEYKADDGSIHQLLVLSHFIPLYPLEYNLHDKPKEIQPIDSLILFRDFVRESKYLHSRKIRYDDVSPANIVLRNHRSFFIDFDRSSEMDIYSETGIWEFLPRSVFLENPKRTALDDWESFLYMMCEVNKIDLEWFEMKPYASLAVDFKMNTKETTKRIRNAKIPCKHLKEVFRQFANETLRKDRSPPDYNRFDKLIMNKIEAVRKEKGMEVALFSWLLEGERKEAIRYLNENHHVEAAQIKFEEPFKYPNVEYDYFVVQKDEMANGHAPSRENYQKKKKEMTEKGEMEIIGKIETV